MPPIVSFRWQVLFQRKLLGGARHVFGAKNNNIFVYFCVYVYGCVHLSVCVVIYLGWFALVFVCQHSCVKAAFLCLFPFRADSFLLMYQPQSTVCVLFRIKSAIIYMGKLIALLTSKLSHYYFCMGFLYFTHKVLIQRRNLGRMFWVFVVG